MGKGEKNRHSLQRIQRAGVGRNKAVEYEGNYQPFLFFFFFSQILLIYKI